MTQFESAQVGISWGNIWSEYENYSVAHGLIMLAIDFAYLSIIGLYLDNVLPKTFGVRKGLCFCLTSSKKSKISQKEETAGDKSGD